MTDPNPIFQMVFSAEAEVTRADDVPQDTIKEQ